MPSLHFLKGKRGEYLVALQFVLIIVFIFAPVWSPFIGERMLDALAPVRWSALVVFGTVAIIFAALGSFNIREYLTPLPYPVDHNQLVQHGIYAWVRHPLYSSQLFAALGWALYTLSLSHLLILALGFVFFDYKAGKEEAWLSERHPEYAEYAHRVRKFIPWIY